MDDYGRFIGNYIGYTDQPCGMEYKLGRQPALEALGPKANQLILDFGCGPAVNGPELGGKEYGADVVGIDISEEELAVARQRDPDSIYLHYDGRNLAEAIKAECRGRKLDGIIATFSVCTVPDKNLGPILREMRQILKPGGRLVIAEPNLEQAMGVKYHDLHYHAQPGAKSGDHVTVTLGTGETATTLYHDIYRTRADYRRLLLAAGFSHVKMSTPRPRSRNLFAWWRAALTPPFLIIVAE